MKVHSIETGFFKLDGGAMFGIVPRQLWQRLNPPDDQNMCTWAMRCLLIEHGDRKILVDTGIGEKQGPKFRSHFHPHGDDSLAGSLAERGFQPEDITDVLLTHLHFDHAGGAVRKESDGSMVPAFPKATYWTHKSHYHWACNPNLKEAASFLKENFIPLEEAGVLQFIPVGDEDHEWLPGIRLRTVFGHTEAMFVLLVTMAGRTMVYCADVIPSTFHIGMPYIMSFDVRPLMSLQEKKRILEDALAETQLLFFEHDPLTPSCLLERNEKGRIVPGRKVSVEDFFNPS